MFNVKDQTQSLSVLCFVFTFAITVTNASAGIKVIVGRPVPPGQRVSPEQVDHTVWDSLLKKHVNSADQVNYRGWKKSTPDVTALDSYLESLSHANTRTRASIPAYLAFWINAYNAITIKGILREYPTSSIRNHSAKLYGYNIWHDLLLVVGDNQISLNDIEHKILRKTGEPRIHFAIVCASHSCPPLRDEAYTSEKLENQLVMNSRRFFANQENFQYRAGMFYLSLILKWFARDFGNNQAAQLRSISPYLPDRASQQAAANGSGRVAYLKYDWSLNERPTARIHTGRAGNTSP